MVFSSRTAALAGCPEQPREPAVLEHPPAGLALRAVEDRVLLEVDAGDRRAAVRARLAEAVVHLVRLLVRRPGEAQLEALGEELADRRRQALDLLVGELGRQRVGESFARLRISFDQARPIPASARWSRRKRVQAPRLAPGDLRQRSAVIAAASGPRWASSASSSSGR